MRNMGSVRIASHATLSVAPTPPSVRAGTTGGMENAVTRPMTDRMVSASGASHVRSPASCKRKPPAAVPSKMAEKVHSSKSPLPAASRSWGISSGRIPYFDGLKSALWTPIPQRTIRGSMPPAGLIQSATVPAAIKRISTTLIVMMTVRLLTRSARVPPTSERSTNGKVKMTNAFAVWVCATVSSSGPGAIPAVACRMASKATISFQALSLKAPQNCAVRRPRRERETGCWSGPASVVIRVGYCARF